MQESMEKEENVLKDNNGIPCMYHEWQNLNGETLGDLFSPSRYSRDGSDPDHVIERYRKDTHERSHETRKILKSELNVPFGENTLQKMDLFIPENVLEDAPVLVFFHGGYWQFLSKDCHSLVARHLVPLGAIVAVPGYSIAPEGTMPQMIQECKDAVAFCARRYPKSRGLFLSGHSAGGHIAAMLLATNWEKEYGLSSNLIKGVFPLCGVFDLRPLVPTYVNEPLHLTSSSALDSSPIAHIPKIVKNSKHCKIHCLYGDHDPPSFEIMAIQFCQLLRDEGLDISCQKVQNADHFEVFITAFEEHSVVTQVLQCLLFPEKCEDSKEKS